MFWNNQKSRPALIGIDCDGSTIHAILLDKDKYGYIATNFSSLPYDSLETQNAALNKINKILFTKNKFIATALTTTEVMTKEVSVPINLCGNELEDFIALNAEKYFACPLANINMDYQINKNLGNQMQSIKIIATRKENIETHFALFKQTNLKPKFLDVDIFALARSAQLLLIKEDETPFAIISIDINRLLFCVIHKNDLIYSQANYFTKENPPAINELLKQIISDIEMYSAAISMPLKKLILAGSLLKKTDIGEFIGTRMNLPVAIAGLDNLQIAKNIDKKKFVETSPSLLISLGLAMRRFEDD